MEVLNDDKPCYDQSGAGKQQSNLANIRVFSDNWTSLIKPKNLEVEPAKENPNKATLTLGPLERGMGVTIGNALRRVLLSSIKGAAVEAVHVNGVSHEFSTIPGVKESYVDLILNLKRLAMCFNVQDNTFTLRFKIKGPKVITVKELINQLPSQVSFLNEDLYICTLAEGHELNFVLYCSSGRGYRTEEQISDGSFPIDTVVLDSVFSPIISVAYKVENARIKNLTNYDKLIMNLETNGAITPERAVGIAAKILQSQLSVCVTFEDSVTHSDKKKDELPFNPVLLKKVNELELSVRAHNCLQNDNIVYIGDLVVKTESDMLKTPNFGRKSLNEIKEVLGTLNLSLGMSIQDWPPKNIEELAKKHEDQYYN